MTLLQALKSIQDIEIIITPKDDDKEQKIINLSFQNGDWNKSFEEFINSKFLRDNIYSLTNLRINEIAKFSCCLLNVKNIEQIKETRFGKTIIESNGKYYN
tara:strand:- start:1216 stop:1518 length:303 start_codon:yes stop_codon:yes gene_type:complete